WFSNNRLGPKTFALFLSISLLAVQSTGLFCAAQAKAPLKKPATGGGGGAPYPQFRMAGKTVRWIPQEMPLKICISPGICLDEAGVDQANGGPLFNVDSVGTWPEMLARLKQNPDLFNNLKTAEGYTDHMSAAAAQGFNQWKRFQNEGLFSFELTDNPDEANVYVFWTHHFVNKMGLALFANDIRGYTAKHLLSYGAVLNALNTGNTALLERSRQPVVVILRTTDLVGAQSVSMPLGKVVSAAAHEMGHVLGIDGHSPNQADLMNVNYGNGVISANDSATIRYLYHLNPDLIP
ncbi:MAG: matrixin family metalloprotease, partial [Candidatus Obscuribacterales bacterium]|nr:matrixin family metalloprotease [Candidatus Obscuribacterales bacterium]